MSLRLLIEFGCVATELIHADSDIDGRAILTEAALMRKPARLALFRKRPMPVVMMCSVGPYTCPPRRF